MPPWAAQLSAELGTLKGALVDLQHTQAALGRDFAAVCSKVDRVSTAGRTVAKELRARFDDLLVSHRALRKRLSAVEEVARPNPAVLQARAPTPAVSTVVGDHPTAPSSPCTPAQAMPALPACTTVGRGPPGLH